ncbi:hypothetical protein [Streptomyces sp. NBC_00996]|uniref:hypothetical protein n=1 Tax=Streptomyces sp. NBC_00996 TaxID=2903710 RepID=UPI003867C137|nr:hypothetical protein OG390_32830 [Streptomyces sp. NBC_00996]
MALPPAALPPDSPPCGGLDGEDTIAQDGEDGADPGNLDHDPDVLTLPALDCHTGDVPALNSEVPVDHWVLLGTDEAPEEWGFPVDYGEDMRHDLRQFLPGTVVGRYFDGTLPNGDFCVRHEDLLAGDPDGLPDLDLLTRTAL